LAKQGYIEENKRSKGAAAEQMAADYLTQRGMRIIRRNFRCRQGEIDLIGYHNGYLVFVEVKYRSNSKNGMPEEAVGAAKQRVICQVADYYRYCQRLPLSTPVRYDVVAIAGEEIRWVQNAFSHCYH